MNQSLNKTLRSWIGIVVGCTIMASGFVFFINPYNIVPGGVYGASIVLHNLFPSIQVGTFGYMFDVPLLIMSVLVLGSKLGGRTIAAALMTPFIMNMISMLIYPTEEALHQLDPAQMLGGTMNLSDHLMLATIMGSVLIGVGCGMVVRNQATTGGSDIVAMMLQKYFHIQFSKGILLVDAVVVTFGLVVIGFGLGDKGSGSEPSWLLSFYSLIAIFLASRVISYMLNGPKTDKLMFIISDKRTDDLHKYILQELDRSATHLKGSGLYSGGDKDILFLVVSYKQASLLKVKIKEADPKAFVIMTDAYDAFGEGWKTLPSANELQPE